MSQQTSIANPYVGPRTFGVEQRHLFFGREREARDLLGRVLSERLLLFYAQSGAGKSSLLHTRLIPQLQEEKGFVVLPVGRVSSELLAGTPQVENIYAFNLMLSIDAGDEPGRLARVSMSDFLARLTRRAVVDNAGQEYMGWVYDATLVPTPASPSARRYALIIDQFEEIITGHAAHWRERADFFRQLDQAMRDDPNLWVVLTLREDYVASLDPYAPMMTDRLRARFYMERMGIDAALDAIRKPAEFEGRPFAPGVAEKLVGDLRQVRVAGQEQTVAGQHVEPVQLQVVCYQMWENVAGRPDGPIRMTDLEGSGDVDQALANFYEDALKVVLAEPTVDVSERQLRTWFGTELITEAGTRGTIYQGEKKTGGMSNLVVHILQDRFLLRAELRAGGSWIELVHDRFVDPIRAANLRWQLNYANPLAHATRAWIAADRDPARLASVKQLTELQAYAKLSSGDITADEQNFLEESKRRVLDAAIRRRSLFTTALISSSAIVVLVVIALLVASGLRGTWQPVEPVLHAGSVSAATISVNGSEAVYAVTPSGPNRNDSATLLKYTPEDRAWNILARNLTTKLVWTMMAVTVDGNDRIYISIRSTGLIRSDDQGESWQEINTGLTSQDIRTLAVDPSNPQILYAGSGDTRGVFQSQDSGDNWQNISDAQGFVGLSVLSMVHSSYQSPRLLAGTDDGRIIAYDQDAETWHQVSVFPGAGKVSAMAIEPTQTQVIYAGTSNGKVFRSEDGGESWPLLDAIPGVFAITSLAVVPYEPKRVYVAGWGIGGQVLWKSTDGGRTWNHTADDTFSRQTLPWLLMPPLDPNILYAAGDAGIFVTKDGGRSWLFQNMGSPQIPIEGIKISTADGGPYYITYGGSLFSSDSLSNTIQWRRGRGLPATSIRDVATDPKHPLVAYAAVYVQNEWSVFRTDDGGEIWTKTGLPPIPEPELGDTRAVAIAKSADADILYAGSSGCGVFHSLDGAKTWETFGRQECKVQSATAPRNVIDMAVAYENVNLLYVAAESTRFYVSSDRGEEWQTYALSITSQIDRIALDPYLPAHIYLIAGVDGFWRSEDGGQNWIALSKGLENSTLIDLVVVPDRPETLFIAADSGEVWKTTNGGRNWTSIRENLPLTQIGALAFDVRKRELWIGSRLGGLFKYQLGYLEGYQLKAISKQ